jgi:hypothetical protein
MIRPVSLTSDESALPVRMYQMGLCEKLASESGSGADVGALPKPRSYMVLAWEHGSTGAVNYSTVVQSVMSGSRNLPRSMARQRRESVDSRRAPSSSCLVMISSSSLRANGRLHTANGTMRLDQLGARLKARGYCNMEQCDVRRASPERAAVHVT